MKRSQYFKYFLSLLSIFNSTALLAQKLINVQNSSIYAPVNVKIDGKSSDWNNMFQAHNNATDVDYLLANDKENLYLTIQAIDKAVITRIVAGGVTLTINQEKKSDNISVTYPTYDTPDGKSATFLSFNKIHVSEDQNTDSIMLQNNKLIDNRCKYIRVKGIKGVDTLLSIYNEFGIKAAGKFESIKKYVLELSVPLKYFDILKDQIKFTYNIRLNGLRSPIAIGVPTGSQTAEQNQNLIAGLSMAMANISAPTDFSGQYILAKK